MPALANMLTRFRACVPNEEARAEMNERWLAAEREAKARACMERIRAARIPERYANASLAECMGAVQAYAGDVLGGAGSWMVLQGKNGRGKTHQAAAVVRAVAREKRCMFTTMQHILDECKDTFGRPESLLTIQNRYTSVPFLVIDDFGKEQATDWSLAVIFAVIDGRYSKCRPTLFTTNMGAAELLEHLGYKGERTMAESVLSRMMDATYVEVTGADRRVRGGGRHG